MPEKWQKSRIPAGI